MWCMQVLKCLNVSVQSCIEISHCPDLSKVDYSSAVHSIWTNQPVLFIMYTYVPDSLFFFPSLFQRFMWAT